MNEIVRQIVTNRKLPTPFYLFDLNTIRDNASRVRGYSDSCDIRLLYSLKANDTPEVVSAIAEFVYGFTVSSLPNARQAASQSNCLHFTAPGFRADEYKELLNHVSHISFNSVSLANRHGFGDGANVRYGLRVNPRISYAADPRYDPCRELSRLGATLGSARNCIAHSTRLTGLHFHNNCESGDLTELSETLEYVLSELECVSEKIEWINMGGGYDLENGTDVTTVDNPLRALRNKWKAEYFWEPGGAMVRDGGYLVSEIVDVVLGDSLPVAVLDTTVNHWPEVFEYGFQPELLLPETSDETDRTYQLAGRSCLAGDIFGTHNFGEELSVGERIVFRDAGAYSIVKMNRFNGIEPPSVYVLSEGEVFPSMGTHAQIGERKPYALV